jgi:hypothetical protein
MAVYENRMNRFPHSARLDGCSFGLNLKPERTNPVRQPVASSRLILQLEKNVVEGKFAPRLAESSGS